MLARIAAFLIVVALTANPAVVPPASAADPSAAYAVPATLTPPTQPSISPYLGRHLSWTTFDQLSGDGSAGPSNAASLYGVAGGPGLIVETGRDGPTGKAAAWTSSDGGTSWTEHVQMAGPASFRDVVAHAGVYVTWSDDGLYSSTDGATWTRAATGPHAIRWPFQIAAGPQGFLVFVRNGSSATTRVWRSATGASGTWTADPVQSVVSTFCPDSVVVTSARVVASGHDCSTHRARILVNASGRTWVRAATPSGMVFLNTPTSVSYVSSRYLLTGANSTESATWVWSSTNGLAWKHISSMPRAKDWSPDHISRIVRLAPGWLAIGDRNIPADDGMIVVWASGDLVHWSRSVPRLISSCPGVTVQMVSQATVLAGRLFAVGTAWDIAEACGETWTATVVP